MQKEIRWTSAFLNERFTTVVSPLGWSFIGTLFEQLALRDPLRYMGFPGAEKIPAVRLWNGHPYVNVEIFQIFYKPFPDALVPADAGRYFPNADLAFRKRSPYPRSILQPRFLFSLAYHLLRDPLVASPLNFVAWNRFTESHNAQIAQRQRELDAATNAQQVLRVIEGTWALDARFLYLHRWSLTYADLFYRMLTHLYGRNAQKLISDVPNKTREANAELAALAQMSPPLAKELVDKFQSHGRLTGDEENTVRALERFLQKHGHRAFSLDIAQPTFRDDPSQLLALMPQRDWKAIISPSEIKKKGLFSNSPVGFARRYARLREDQRWYWQRSLALTRAAYLILGRDLAARGILAEPNDIFYAVCQDITAYYGMEIEPDELSARIHARKREWDIYAESDRVRGAAAYPHFLRGDVPVQEDTPNEKSQMEWRGRGVSAGIARGAARIVQHPNELGRVNGGEILVVPSTDPAWTPVFARIGALVMERGGVLSHGAVVAREYHLPAVAAISNLTTILADGEWIEVDGTNGIVRRVSAEEHSA